MALAVNTPAEAVTAAPSVSQGELRDWDLDSRMNFPDGQLRQEISQSRVAFLEK